MNASATPDTAGGAPALLSVSDLKVHFPRAKQGWFKPPEVVRAVSRSRAARRWPWSANPAAARASRRCRSWA